ncbi:tRNA pseudouridine(55) synthase TruB [Helicobacter saguini]|uniref:tRNA pseudouridine(55) synthase n=1 Tax=Helicobacter saguini TaxID=1548018 RepID=A0A347VNW7_9HELI|nr:hypothetical protein [Helicobacter saguini]MWV61607.1 tRNA pseudouridine(55) synthase TruB [Helicobacter saguini]MWV67721.1 tRNA pseudouridine(55) synthase TruB [Helicobacter saguini]MWV70073.1 tRNA pseudouridine(55) synthase TruB [Helicobacter saguini]MWV72714.1 tRNA pseudouridine(55) synthase TruB [Helicobacter saguini]TLD92021.1 tRNA pseudouridine(55) synthase TruB [Helicobacter saguini]
MNSKNNIKTSDFLALAFKIPNISSLSFANAIKFSLNKQGFNIAKMGFLGTLDPFACGQLLLASNTYTRLLNHINVAYKTYRATLFLGLNSASLDSENVERVDILKPFSVEQICSVLDSINDKILEYEPPKFSAKQINGQRAYNLARKGVSFNIQHIKTHIKNVDLLNYCHPFLSFEITLSSGGYVRSVGDLIAGGLGVCGALCYLERVSEDDFCYLDSIKSMESLESGRQDSIKSLESSFVSKDFGIDSKLDSIISTNFNFQGINYPTKLAILNIESALKYDKINLAKYEKDALCGKKIKLDSKDFNLDSIESNSQELGFIESNRKNVDVSLLLNMTNKIDSIESKRFLADFNSHFSIIDIHKNGEIKYILNNIKK